MICYLVVQLSNQYEAEATKPTTQITTGKVWYRLQYNNNWFIYFTMLFQGDFRSRIFSGRCAAHSGGWLKNDWKGKYWGMQKGCSHPLHPPPGSPLGILSGRSDGIEIIIYCNSIFSRDVVNLMHLKERLLLTHLTGMTNETMLLKS